MTALGYFCVAMVVVSISRDFFLADARAVEVWFGFELTGAAAMITAPIHWAIFAAGAWAFLSGRVEALSYAAAYVFYAAFSHIVWSEASPHGRGWKVGLLQAAVISAFGVALMRARASADRRDQGS